MIDLTISDTRKVCQAITKYVSATRADRLPVLSCRFGIDRRSSRINLDAPSSDSLGDLSMNHVLRPLLLFTLVLVSAAASRSAEPLKTDGPLAKYVAQADDSYR